LGEQDAKAGMALHMPEIGKWPEVQGSEAMLQQLLEAYNKAMKSAVTR
jgi:hypothetical protein